MKLEEQEAGDRWWQHRNIYYISSDLKLHFLPKSFWGILDLSWRSGDWDLVVSSGSIVSLSASFNP